MSTALAIPDLRGLVAELAVYPEAWSRLVRHDPTRRVYERLDCGAGVSAWVISWMPGHDTGLHDHGASSGAVAVVRGKVLEERLRPGGATARTYGPGALFHFAPGDVHRVRHVGEEPAVTLHAYSPVLDAMGAWVPGRDGELRRRSLAGGAELRPPAGLAA